MYDRHIMKMIRKIFHLTVSQVSSLEDLSKYDGLSISEHVRKALQEYINKKEVQYYKKVTASASKRGIING